MKKTLELSPDVVSMAILAAERYSAGSILVAFIAGGVCIILFVWGAHEARKDAKILVASFRSARGKRRKEARRVTISPRRR